MIKNFLTFKELGVFGIAYKFSSILSFLSVGVNNAILPLIYNNHKDKTTPTQISKILNLYILLSFILMTIISVFSRELILLFATNEYMAATKVIPFLILITILASISNFFPGLAIAKKTKIIAYINIFTAAFSIIANYFLIKKIGILGSCYANLFAFILLFSINYFFSQKYYPINIYFSKIFKIITISSILIIINYFMIELNLVFYVFIKFLSLFIYIPLCLIIFYSKETISNKLGLIFKFLYR
jgi:O-antigen/teichoic acid export membrane protein